MEGHEGVDHGAHGNQGEEASGDAADAVAEIEEADGQTAQDDGEIEPGEEGALVGEEDLGLNARGEGYAFACCFCRAVLSVGKTYISSTGGWDGRCTNLGRFEEAVGSTW